MLFSFPCKFYEGVLKFFQKSYGEGFGKAYSQNVITSSETKMLLDLKEQDTTIHLLEWWKSKTLTPSDAGEDEEQQELSFIADGNAK